MLNERCILTQLCQYLNCFNFLFPVLFLFSLLFFFSSFCLQGLLLSLRYLLIWINWKGSENFIIICKIKWVLSILQSRFMWSVSEVTNCCKTVRHNAAVKPFLTHLKIDFWHILCDLKPILIEKFNVIKPTDIRVPFKLFSWYKVALSYWNHLLLMSNLCKWVMTINLMSLLLDQQMLLLLALVIYLFTGIWQNKLNKSQVICRM